MPYTVIRKPMAYAWKTIIGIQNHHTLCTGMSTGYKDDSVTKIVCIWFQVEKEEV